ncbi:hsp70 nucleotide exchange factor fes1 [Yamadazyma tenuis]|uniref:Hsp70 nucleotide exchange factor FES1 n=1 Tax=Candida tenuis (strain ATCC 10573 / BCRC 21748 / CBS 615 / JCM 9827 / NBRC 10315 / NRRL Y-1498 / VKM Y-70) TaxID=590646 RepID=G3B3K9_CANTC|nr:Fes1-domain-containing protein [Yamadazyma tenuis ATCC 10573]EGV64178.1 Fes1-domain-containing protein [Yamadazyma tenuis ATCC 10573]WEJ96164.1 hsp70 nucleotide exchange factor fes1 [Yamadazyma tenuis]
MDKLLAWSLAQQSGDKEAMAKIGQPDMKALNSLFGGVDEPTLMTQAMLVAQNPEASVEDREVALENFEMLIENLDNANNIENLKLWPAVISLLDESVDSSLRVLAASIVGIAVQNNTKSQEDFLKYDTGFKSLVQYSVDPSTSVELKLKLLFAISSLVRNNQDSFKFFNKLKGWTILTLLDKHDNHKVDIRVLSVLSSVLTSESLFKSEIEAKLHEYKLVDKLINSLLNDNITCMEKSLSILGQLISLNFKFEAGELKLLSKNIDKISHLKEEYSEDFAKIRKITKSA